MEQISHRTLGNETEQAIGSAHGKVILIGEHSVVYKMPAIAFPFQATETTVEVSPNSGTSIIESSYYSGKITQVPHHLNNFLETVKAVCEHLDKPITDLKLVVKSDIPPERGMGSSAAVACALIRALFTYFKADLTTPLLYKFMEISEKIAHGNPSGLDMRIVSSDDPIYFIKDQEHEFFTLDMPAYLITADTGIKGQTKEAVSDVADLIKESAKHTQPILHSLGRLTKRAKIAIEKRNPVELGEILSKAHNHLRDLTVSNDVLDKLVDVAIKSGAIGAKMTGGGRGGCMIALADTLHDAKRISEELSKAGAVKTWINPLGEVDHE